MPCGPTLIVHLTSSLWVGSVISLKQQLALLHFNPELRFSNLIQPSKPYWVILQTEPTGSVVRIFPGGSLLWAGDSVMDKVVLDSVLLELTTSRERQESWSTSDKASEGKRVAVLGVGRRL